MVESESPIVGLFFLSGVWQQHGSNVRWERGSEAKVYGSTGSTLDRSAPRSFFLWQGRIDARIVCENV
jgi:hypothetical protein